MTDERLQSLFDGTQCNLGAHMAEFEQRVNRRYEEVEHRYKWARVVEARMRMFDGPASTIRETRA
ncbi:MAG TPA: hypothetical protein VGL72_16550 [Bryobacteraceae bacterium]|jgi:hypothetical protein